MGVTRTSQMTDEEFASAVADVIAEALGVDGLARFMTMFCSAPGKDYTRDKQIRQQAEADLAPRE